MKIPLPTIYQRHKSRYRRSQESLEDFSYDYIRVILSARHLQGLGHTFLFSIPSGPLLGFLHRLEDVDGNATLLGKPGEES